MVKETSVFTEVMEGGFIAHHSAVSGVQHTVSSPVHFTTEGVVKWGNEGSTFTRKKKKPTRSYFFLLSLPIALKLHYLSVHIKSCS